MTKEDFLIHLEKRLQILKQKEREDILGEYAQHIELKMLNGLSGEEAIRDFGDLDELAREILDAYNVDPEFGRGEKYDTMMVMGEIGKKAEEAGRKAGNGLASLGRSFLGLIRRLAASCKRGILKLVHRLTFRNAADRNVRGISDGTRRLGLLIRQKGGGDVQKRSDRSMRIVVGNAGRKFVHFIILMLSVCWKLCVAVFLAPFVFGSALALIGTGVLIVMVVLGYPLVGILIMTAGALACGVSLVWFVWELAFGRRKEESIIWEPEQN